jgi:hypothetical protein
MNRDAEMVSRQNTGSDLHFRTGVTGRLARFIVARRTAGDPFDATVVLPCLIFLILVRLNEIGRVDDSFVWPGLYIPAFLAGWWIGICLDVRGTLRAILRGVLVGAFEGAALTGLVKEAMSQPKAIGWVIALMYSNAMLFWGGAFLAGFPSDILTVTEEQYQKAAPRREKIRRIFRLVLAFDEIKGVPTGIGLLVRTIQFLGPPVLLAWFHWFIGGNPIAVLKSMLHYTS